jgi:hypothetical protein
MIKRLVDLSLLPEWCMCLHCRRVAVLGVLCIHMLCLHWLSVIVISALLLWLSVLLVGSFVMHFLLHGMVR